MPSPKHFPEADQKSPVADAEETHHEPIQKEAERECDAEHLPVSQQLLELSRAPSLCPRSVQLMTVCRGISGANNNSTHQPGSQTGVTGGQAKRRRMMMYQGCREDNCCLSSLKTAPAESPVPQPLQGDAIHCPSHLPPRPLVFTGYIFKTNVLTLGSSCRALGCLVAQLQSLLH